MEAKEQLIQLFEETAKKLPQFKEFLLKECMPIQVEKSPFDLAGNSSKLPWIPYLKVSSGNDHESIGQLFYAIPSWDGTPTGYKYRYLGKQKKFYIVARTKYIVEYGNTGNMKRITKRFLSDTYSAPPTSSLYRINTVYLATEVPELGYGIVALEGVRTRIPIVNELITLLNKDPVAVTLSTVKQTNTLGTFWNIENNGTETVGWDTLPFKELIEFVKKYNDLNKEIRSNLLAVNAEITNEENAPDETDDVPF